MNNKEEFIRAFAINFCASLSAIQYQSRISDGDYETLNSMWMMEDALFLGEKAWEKYNEHKGSIS